MNSWRNYANTAREEPVESWQVYRHRPRAPQISFTEEDEDGIHYLYCDALVVRAVVAINGLGRMLVDDGSAVNILFGNTFVQMDVDHELTAISELLFDFTEDRPVLQEMITLAACAQGFTSCDIHLSLGNEFLNVGKGCQNLRQSDGGKGLLYECITKGSKARGGYPVVMTIHSEPMDVDPKKMNKKMILDEGLDPRIICSDSLASPVEELETFPVNLSNPTQMLQVGQRLEKNMKEELK
ncbi:Ribonuclease H [Abeliophyllum distichum]|uniref:Ribonuclease H n=1 Tax=Abeliophyllum distichum TaxID=126358 RepID=A0ABD1NRS2_9LAMI